MKRTSAIRWYLIAGVAVTFLWGALSAAESQVDQQIEVSTADETPESAPGDTIKAAPEVIAYYFHTTYRCASCKKIEAFSREAIESGFVEELNNGSLQFLCVNIDEDTNKHFAKDYELYTKSLVICDMKDGKQIAWKNLAKVWELISNKDEFVKYVQDEINAYLKES